MNRPEQRTQMLIASWLDWVLPPPFYYSAIGHGGGGELRGKILRGMGVKRGIWDVMILGPLSFIAWMEIKSARGVLSAEQRAFGDMVRSMGHRTATVKSLDEARQALQEWGVPLRETKPHGAAIMRSLAAALAQDRTAQPDSKGATNVPRRRRVAAPS